MVAIVEVEGIIVVAMMVVVVVVVTVMVMGVVSGPGRSSVGTRGCGR
jgi:hypothetical protein